jgi:hypothetical protein
VLPSDLASFNSAFRIQFCNRRFELGLFRIVSVVLVRYFIFYARNLKAFYAQLQAFIVTAPGRTCSA